MHAKSNLPKGDGISTWLSNSFTVTHQITPRRMLFKDLLCILPRYFTKIPAAKWWICCRSICFKLCQFEPNQVQWCSHKWTRDSLYSSLTLFLHWEERKTRKHDCQHDMRAVMPQAARSMVVRRWVKRATWRVSYNILDSWHLSQINSIGWSMKLWCTSVSNL